MYRRLIFCCLILLSACRLSNPFAEEIGEISPCDPIANIYIDGKHFFGRDNVKEDGTVDYKKWFDSRKVESSPCDPIKKKTQK